MEHVHHPRWIPKAPTDLIQVTLEILSLSREEQPLLPPPVLKPWEYRCVPPCVVCAALGIEPVLAGARQALWHHSHTLGFSRTPLNEIALYCLAYSPLVIISELEPCLCS